MRDREGWRSAPEVDGRRWRGSGRARSGARRDGTRTTVGALSPGGRTAALAHRRGELLQIVADHRHESRAVGGSVRSAERCVLRDVAPSVGPEERVGKALLPREEHRRRHEVPAEVAAQRHHHEVDGHSPSLHKRSGRRMGPTQPTTMFSTARGRTEARMCASRGRTTSRPGAEPSSPHREERPDARHRATSRACAARSRRRGACARRAPRQLRHDPRPQLRARRNDAVETRERVSRRWNQSAKPRNALHRRREPAARRATR